MKVPLRWKGTLQTGQVASTFMDFTIHALKSKKKRRKQVWLIHAIYQKKERKKKQKGGGVLLLAKDMVAGKRNCGIK